MAPLISDVQPTIAPLPDDFGARWHAWYPDAPPIGFLLREAYPERWFRIHSLPRAQRYPRSGAQQAELHRRHATVATDILGDGAACALLVFRECQGRWHRSAVRNAGLGLDDLPSVVPLPATLWGGDAGAFTGPVELAGAAVKWQATAFTGFVAAVANDAARALVVNLTSGRLYAPYKGGADLFLTSETERDLIRRHYAAWLPPNEHGR